MSKRLLFVTSTRIGDAILSSGVLARLLAETPELAVTVACGPLAAPLFAGVPQLERLLPMPKQKRGGHWWALWREVVGTRWDIVVDLRGSALAWTLPWVRQRRVIGKTPAGLHRVQALTALVGGAPPAPHLWTLPEHQAQAAEVLAPLGDGPLLAVAPVANWRGKTWPADRFAALTQRLTQRLTPHLTPQTETSTGPSSAAGVLVVCGPGEEAQAAPLLEALPPQQRVLLSGQVPLLTVASCLQRCRLFVGNDSGLMHMAAAMGTPTLGLFGPSRVETYAPWGEHTACVRTPEAYETLVADLTDWSQAPCLMMGLTVERAEEAAVALLERTAPNNG